MNPIPSPTPAAEEQAALWAARLDGSELSAADRAELDRWLAAHPAHRPLLTAYCQFSADLEQQLPLLAGIRDEVAEVPPTAKNVRPLPWLRWPILAGVTLTAAAALAVILWPARPQNHFQNLTAPVAQRQAVTLPDGSHVELNAGTALAVEFRPDSRHARLAHGEAFFRVDKDAARPFYVETPAGSVRVTGTEFNVRAESPTGLEVTVREGSVQVRPGHATSPQALRAGDRLVSAPTGLSVTRLTPDQLNDALAWREGRIVFADTPLAEALARFARYHGRSLTVSSAAAGRRVGGSYSLDDLDGFLSGIADSLHVSIDHGPDGRVHLDALPGS